MNAEGWCYFVGVNVGVKCRCKYCFGGNSGGNADVNVGNHVGDFKGGKKRFGGDAKSGYSKAWM